MHTVIHLLNVQWEFLLLQLNYRSSAYTVLGWIGTLFDAILRTGVEVHYMALTWVIPKHFIYETMAVLTI